MAHCCQLAKKKKKKRAWPIAAIAKKILKSAWPIIAIDQNAFQRIHWSERGTWLSERSKLGEIKAKMKDLRQAKKGKKDPGKSFKELDTIVIQRFSTEFSGKAQKYSHVGARELVSFEDFDELSISNIKKSMYEALRHSMLETMSCNVLAGEQGPLCS